MTDRRVSFADHVLTDDDRVLRSRTGRLSVRFSKRAALTAVALTVLVIALLVASLLMGEYRVSPGALVHTLLGDPPNRLTDFFVMTRRLPRALVAVSVGAALAVAGGVFQSSTRNPLASPDMLGISHGASVGAVVVILLLDGSLGQAAIGAVVGSIVAAAVILLISARSGLQGVQLVLSGVALAAIASAIVDYLLTQVFVASATTAQTWLIGSLQGRSWEHLWPMLIALVAAGAVLTATAPAARLSALGDSLPVTLGVRAVRLRWIQITVATLLVAIAVATAGPIAFIALVAPHIAFSLAGSRSLIVTALTGAFLLGASDLIAQYALSGPIPVGAVTVVLGGVFFLWLVFRQGRRRA
ncbi:iron-enterobactin transporter permease [Gordonia spumicola]|uniref:Iron-enterobactin transporter permease n=1 Tax=Gordonia spumicola TaxID=589161 RepID=A0A7I9VC11_9ACTN|nr:iron chelate uptake ABC transporter family permease subunit [Gordonia spumicola]GEE02908.1 iron-enterobactin transporter permease [Gordonia spumicola]